LSRDITPNTLNLYYFCILPQLIELKLILVGRIDIILGNLEQVLIEIKLALVGRIDIILGNLKQVLIEIKLAILGRIGSMLGDLKEGWVILKKLAFIGIKSLGLFLIEMGNIPAHIGKLLVQWVNWVLDEKLDSITRKPLPLFSYIKLRLIDPCLSRIRDNKRHWDLLKSMPTLSPVRIRPVPISSGANYNDLVFIKGYLNSFISSVYLYMKNTVNRGQLFNMMELLDYETVKIHLYE
jgi:hypothetical protein